METDVNNNRVSKYFNLPQLGQAQRNLFFKEEDKLYKNTIEIHNKNYIFGIEVEVENVPTPRVYGKYQTYWNMTTDGSLRNNGVEFVSLPIRMDQIEGALKQLDMCLPLTRDFSPRTSVHIHMNVRDMTISQINSLVLLYTMVENFMFSFAGESRKNNVFCIRLQDTAYVTHMQQFRDNTYEVVRSWNKYTALNLAPIFDKGTVEFRHMRGTLDVITLLNWVNFIACLKTYAKTHSPRHIREKVEELNTFSTYDMFLREIFGELLPALVGNNDIKSNMEEAVSYVKLTKVMETKKEVTTPTVEQIEAVRNRIRFNDILNNPTVGVDIPQPVNLNRTNF